MGLYPWTAIFTSILSSFVFLFRWDRKARVGWSCVISCPSSQTRLWCSIFSCFKGLRSCEELSGLNLKWLFFLCIFQNGYFPPPSGQTRGDFPLVFILRNWWDSWRYNPWKCGGLQTDWASTSFQLSSWFTLNLWEFVQLPFKCSEYYWLWQLS